MFLCFLFISGRFIRGEHYLYKFTEIGSREANAGYWWKRTRTGSYFPPINLQAVREYLKSHGMETAESEEEDLEVNPTWKLEIFWN